MENKRHEIEKKRVGDVYNFPYLSIETELNAVSVVLILPQLYVGMEKLRHGCGNIKTYNMLKKKVRMIYLTYG